MKLQWRYAYLAALHILGSSRCPLAGGMAARLIEVVLYRSSMTLIDVGWMNDDCVDAWFMRDKAVWRCKSSSFATYAVLRLKEWIAKPARYRQYDWITMVYLFYVPYRSYNPIKSFLIKKKKYSAFYLLARLPAYLFIIAKENLHRQPVVTANLESILEVAEFIKLLRAKLPTIKLEVLFDALFVYRLRNDTPPFLQTPDKQNLLRSFSFLLGDLEQCRIFVQRRVCRSEAGVSGTVNSLRGIVCHKFRRRIVGVQLDLVDCWDDLGCGSTEQTLKVLDAEIGHTNVSDLTGGRKLLHFLPVA